MGMKSTSKAGKETSKSVKGGFKMPSANSTDSRERELAHWFAEQSGKMKKGKLSADNARKIGMFPIFGSNKKDT